MDDAANRFKKLFVRKDYVLANELGQSFIKAVRDRLPQFDIDAVENATQASQEVLPGTPGKKEASDITIMIGLGGVCLAKLYCEITGDTNHLLSDSHAFPFNAAAVNRLLSKPDDGWRIAVYYLKKETPPRFFVMTAEFLEEYFDAHSSQHPNCRGDDGVKHWPPPNLWGGLDGFLAILKTIMEDRK